jgi:diacylglycerol O-acyltransferase
MTIVRLSGADALSLHTQSRKVPAHTVAVVVMEASERLSHQRLHQVVAASLPQLARFRSRLVAKPLGVGQPVWAEIDDYDPLPHIHSATVRAPGGQREFADLIAHLSAASRRRRQPLWEAWSINGLAGGRWALAVTMSPALNDGAAGAASVWPRLLTAGPNEDPANNLPIEPSIGSTPSVADMVTDAVTEIVENQLTGMWLIGETVFSALQTANRRLLGSTAAAPASSTMSGPVPRTVFNEPLTQRRSVAFSAISLADVKTVSSAFGGSITNVVLTACAMSLRAWLKRHATVPDHPLLMRMPFELPATDHTRIGQALTVGRLRVPVHLDDPVQILANLHTATERLNVIRDRDAENESSAVDFAVIGSLVPPTVARAGMELFRRSGMRNRLTPTCHGAVSYTAVEPVPAYCAGARVAGINTVAPLTDGCGLSVALTARDDVLGVSVCACPDNVPAVDEIATGIALSIDILVTAAAKSPRGQGRSVVTEMVSHPANRPRGR